MKSTFCIYIYFFRKIHNVNLNKISVPVIAGSFENLRRPFLSKKKGKLLQYY